MVSAWEAILMGIIQGLTEFLPVSSSGHLIIIQALLGFDGSDMIRFTVFVHIGTLIAVFVAFWQDIKAILLKPFQRITALLIIGTIPGALIGLFFYDIFTMLFDSLIVVACALIVTGILLMVSDRFNGTRKVEDMSIGSAALVGLFQGIAITPGLSRSSTTIFGALLCGLKRKEAARFSFLLSIPIILGATFFEAFGLITTEGMDWQWTYLLGAVVAGLCGYFAIRVFLRLITKRRLRYFSYYCWAIAATVLISQLFI
jgi:undecaprenyl-diphosphatase